MSVTAVVPAAKRVGKYTLAIDQVRIAERAAVVGPREGAGPLGPCFDQVEDDHMAHQPTPEKAERYFLKQAVQLVLQKAGLAVDEIDFFLSGDLLNQVISSSFTARDLGIPFFGLFSACATFGAALTLGSVLVDGGYANRVIIGASSHYQSAERQYRYPIELNVQRKATNQWTVTGAGAALLAREGSGPRISMVTPGRVVDYGLSDTNDMGSAMAPAAADTLLRHLSDTGRSIGDYDLIVTGDLSAQGSKMFRLLAKDAGITLGNTHQDCGVLIYSQEQQPSAGGSGAACFTTVILGYILSEMQNTRYRRVLAIPTGALHNPLTASQGETIPCVAHAVVFESKKERRRHMIYFWAFIVGGLTPR